MKASLTLCTALIAAAALLPLAAHGQLNPGYKLVKTVPLGAPDRWDYVVADPDTARVYIAHGDRLTVLDTRSGQVVGSVEGMPGGTHGVAVSRRDGRGFTDDGQKGEAVAFDLKTLKVVGRVPAAEDADGIARDPVTGHIFIIEGDSASLTVIDPATLRAVGTIKVGEKLEYGAADGRGFLYVAGEANGDLVKVDARTNVVVAHWPTPGCKSPHGLAIDEAGRRVFMGCANARMMVVDATSGRLVANLPIGRGNDAVAYDPVRKRVFSSNGRDGTVSVYQQTSPDRYLPLMPIATAVSGRTMTVDPRSGRLFVVVADTDPSATPGGRPHTRPGTTRVLIFDPVG